MKRGARLIIAGGGTGGHLFPGISLAEEFLSRSPGNEVLFVGTRQGIEAEAVPKRGYRVEFVSVGGLKRVSFVKKLSTLFALPVAFLQSWRILRRFRPDVVIGVGGYASGPLVLAAALTGRYAAIQEQNSFAGLTNKILARFVKRVFIAFEEAAKFFPRKKIVQAGNPIRRALAEASEKAAGAAPSEKFRLLVFGGSQGAVALNAAVTGALEELADLKEGLKIRHQSGKVGYAATVEGYEGKGFDAETLPFIDDMAAAYAAADLVVCRSGAISLAEITALGKPSVLVPFPYAAEDHQTRNARALAEAGAAVLIPQNELSPQKLAGVVRELYENRDRLAEMSRRARELGRPRAAAAIIDRCLEEACGGKG